MMQDELYIKLADLTYPCYWSDVSAAVYPGSLSPESTSEHLAEIGFARVSRTTPPEPSKIYDEVVELQPEKVGDAWLQRWSVSRLPIEACKAIVLSQINGACDHLLSQIKASYPASEVEGWAKQEVEARAHVANSNAATPMLSAIAAARGITVADLASRIIVKSDAYAAIYGAVVGTRQSLEDALSAADAETIDLIVWPEPETE